MGQRHQFYFKTVKGWVSLHHQWCYGSGPLWALKRVLEFNNNAKDGYKFGDGTYYRDTTHREIVKSLLSTDAQRGEYQDVIDLEEEMGQKPDPLKGDNNDGITVCDFISGKRPKYAFINIDHLEGQYSSRAALLAPLRAEDYAECYYNRTDKEWKNYGIEKNAKYINKHADLLTIEELAKLFPVMYKECIAERNNILKTKKTDLPLLIGTKFKFPFNESLVEERLKGA